MSNLGPVIKKVIEIPGKLIIKNKLVEGILAGAVIGAVAGATYLGKKLLNKKNINLSLGDIKLNASDDIEDKVLDSTKEAAPLK